MLKRKLKKIPTLNQFILASLAIVMIAIMVMTLFVTNSLFAKSIDSARKVNMDNAKQVASALEADFGSMVRLLTLTQNAFSKLDFHSEGVHEAVESIMENLLDLTPIIHRAWFVFDKGIHDQDELFTREYLNNSGETIHSSTIDANSHLVNPETSSWYTEPMATGEIYVDLNNSYTSTPTGGIAHSAVVSVPIIVDGRTIGVCCADMLYKDMLDQLSDLHLLQSRVIFLLNQTLTILDAYDPSFTGANIADIGFPNFNYIQNTIEQGNTYFQEVMSPILFEKVFLFIQPISFLVGSQQQNLYLHIGTPLRTLYADAYQVIYMVAAANFICMLFISFMIYWGANQVVEPIRELARKAQRVASGDFTEDIFDAPGNELRGKSEIAVLRRAFDEMLRKLRENLLTVEKRVEDRTRELKKLNNYITILMNNTTSYSLLLDSDGKVLYHSASLIKLTGDPNPEAYVNKPYINVLKSLFSDDVFVAASERRLARALAGEEFMEDDTVVWPDGNKMIYRIIYSQITDDNNDLEGVIITAQDITALRLEEAERQLNNMLHSTSLPCVILDEKGGLLAFNDEAVHVFDAPAGLSLEEFSTFYMSIQPEYQPDGRRTQDIRQDYLIEALKNGFAQDTIYLIKPDGTDLYIRVILTRISGAFDSKIITYYHNMTDIVRKEAEAREAEERVRLMLDSIPLICILRDEQGNIIDCNQEAQRVLGIADKVDFCKNYYHYHPEFQPDGTKSTDQINQILQRTVERGSVSFEWTFQTPTGELVPAESKIVRMPWKDKFLLLSFSSDLREKMANEKRMQDSAKREHEAELKKEAAQAANEAKSRFLANMSHEIRTPMNAVLGMSELLLNENLSKRQQRYAADIKSSAIALLDIINDILDVSKIQAGKLSLLPVHFDFILLIDTLSSMTHFLLRDKDVDFILDIQSELPRYLYGDDVRIRQVLLNLLSNAVKFTKEGFVRLTIEATDTTIRFTVSDSGIGIQPEDIHVLFDAFEQLDSMKNRGTRGTGLGLSITKGLLNMMGGQIAVESVYGQGSSFRVDVPKVLGDEKMVNLADSEDITIYAPDARILVVDDNMINLSVTAGLLRFCHIHADTATSGKEAIELVKQNPYDLVFMDYRMPEMSGIEATAIIRQMGISIPIIALTASAALGVKDIMLESGMDDFLTKPIIKADLKALLKKWIPGEKLLPAPSILDTVDSSNEIDATDKEFWVRIEQIGEISLATGLGRIEGQYDVYKKTLQLMVRDIEKSDTNLKMFLMARDMENFRIEVHSIKGSLANIGAMALSTQAYELEVASGKADVGFCVAHLPFLLDSLQALSKKLAEAFAIIRQSDKPCVIPPDLPPVLKKLLNALSDMNIMQIDKEVEHIETLNLTGAVKEEFEKIKDSVMIMDYEAASNVIAELLAMSSTI